MNITVTIPDDVAAHLGAADDVARRALEAFGLAEYQAGRMTESELRRLLGFETRYELDGFLKARGVYADFTLDEIQEQVRAMEQLGF